MLGMPSAHANASGMGGMRAAGDLVARLELTKGMRLTQAKEYVAERLGVEPAALSDPIAMADVRAELGLGRIVTFEATYPDEPNAIEAKFNVSDLLGIPINCVERFKKRTRRAFAASSGIEAGGTRWP
jgi:dimethylamine---corrinoid protein Co-methyltransferase